MAIYRSLVVFLSALLAGPAILLLNDPAFADELPFSHYTADHSTPRLPSTSIQNVHQDQLGFLWLATFSTGVVRYDGERMETFGLADGVIDPTVREIAEDTSGRLWLGGEAGLMVTREPLGDPMRRPVFVTRFGERELPRTRVRHHWLRADPAGGVWLGTAGSGLLHLQVQDDELIGHGGLNEHVLIEHSVLIEPEMAVQPPVSALVVRDDGTVWVALGTSSVVWFDSAAASPEMHALDFDAVPESPFGAFAEQDGTLWAGASDGSLWRFDEGGRNFVRLPIGLGETVKALRVSQEGVVWAGSLGGGLARFDSATGEGRVLRRADGLLSETLWDLEFDREGSLWLAHNAGASKLRSDYPAFQQVTGRGRTPILPEPTAFAVLAPAADGLIWVGTGGGLTALDAGDETLSRRAVLGVADGLSSGSVYAMERDGQGRLWLGTAAGLDILSFEADLPATVMPALGPQAVRDVEVLGRRGRLGNYGFSTVYALRRLTLPGGQVAMCMAGVDGVACHVDGRWKVFGPLAGLPASGATAIAMDVLGHLWVGTKGHGALRTSAPLTLEELSEALGDGLVVTREVFVPAWNRAHGAVSDSIRSLAATNDGTLWVAHAAGLDALRVSENGEPTMQFHLGAAQGLGGDHVVAIEAVPEAGSAATRLWVAAGGGLTEIAAADGTVLRRVTQEDGLLDNEAWVSHSLRVGDDGKVYFGTPRGLTIYDPTRHERAEPVATPRMRRADVRTSAVGNNRVDLAWASATYLDEGAVTFSTRLLGLDDEWSQPSPEAEATYTHLPAFFLPKTYRFQVRTSPSPGVWLDGMLQHPVVISPPWWWAWWAVLLWVALLWGALLWTVRYGNRSRRRNGTKASKTAGA